MRACTRLIATVAVLAPLFAACGSGAVSEGACKPGWPDTIVVGEAKLTPVVVSADLGVGPTEFTFGLLDAGQNAIGGPDTGVDVRFFDLGRSKTREVDGGPAEFFWAVPEARGLYSIPIDLDAAGTWGAEVTLHPPGQAPACEKVRFSVQDRPQAPAVGDAAPRSVTATAADVGGNLAAITSDAAPDPALYRHSISELIDAHTPFVVAFATPKFCTSRTCGPTVDQLKAVAAEHPECTFVHVEIFADLDKAAPDVYVPAVTEWHLPSEPWVFAVGADGKVAARFEGATSDQSLRHAVETVCPKAAT